MEITALAEFRWAIGVFAEAYTLATIWASRDAERYAFSNLCDINRPVWHDSRRGAAKLE
jgi:hypothetical protein